MNVIARLVAATGAVILWAYARACRERTATQRRLARANLLRTVSAHPARTEPTRDPFNIVKITPADAERLSAIHNRRLLDDLEQTVEALPIADLTPEQRGSFTMPATGAPQSGATR